jgi:hypothetical protein
MESITNVSTQDGSEKRNAMNTLLYLMGGLLEGRTRSDRDLRHLRAARAMRRDARAQRRRSTQR